MSTSIIRVFKNFYRNGVKKSLRQIAQMNDTKSGHIVGVDDYGNKFYETSNPEEIHMRTRWVEYKDFWRPDMSQIEPGWHFWLAYGTDTPPNQLKPSEKAIRHIVPAQEKQHPVTYSCTRGAYVPYNTAKPTLSSWSPKLKERV